MQILVRLIVLASPVFLLSACQTQPAKEATAITEISAELSKGQAQSSESRVVIPPPAISAALIPSIELSLGADTGVCANRFDVRVNNAQAREFYMGLVEDTPYNMVVHPDVTGTISLNLKNVTIPDVMATLRDVYGYEFNQTSAGFHVLPVRLQSRIFYVNSLNLKRSGTTEMTVSSGQITQSMGADEESTVSESRAASKISTTNETDIWSELRMALGSIIGTGDGRSIPVSPQAGIVVVRAMPAELREVENFLTQVQSSLQRQVVLEAKIMEVQLNDGYQAGINWAQISRSGNDLLALSQTGGGTIFDTGVNSTTSGSSGSLDTSDYKPIDMLGIVGFGGVFSAAIKLGDFAAFIELLKTQGNVQILSSPRVSTMNNEKAIIKVGQDEFFVTDVSSTTVIGAGASTSTPDITLTPFFSGIALDVTPQIDRNGVVNLHIHPSISEVTDQVKELIINGEPQVLPMALTTDR